MTETRVGNTCNLEQPGGIIQRIVQESEGRGILYIHHHKTNDFRLKPMLRRLRRPLDSSTLWREVNKTWSILPHEFIVTDISINRITPPYLQKRFYQSSSMKWVAIYRANYGNLCNSSVTRRILIETVLTNKEDILTIKRALVDMEYWCRYYYCR